MISHRLDREGRLVDPRLCPGVRADGSWNRHPSTKTNSSHEWSYTYDRGNRHCEWCEITESELNQAFFEWRYEQLITRNTAVLERLVTLMENRR
jgi:hypothetical protein